VAELNRRFSDLDLGFVDAAIVALAQSLGLARVATTDRRHFEPLAAALSLELLP
jgi:predicted nucleic acid-binding protein